MTGQANSPARAVRQDYREEPFFFREEFEPASHRWVSWPGTVHRLRHLIPRVLARFSGTVHILLKLEDEADDDAYDERRWRRFYGACPLADVMNAIDEHEDVVLVDGGSQLCVRANDGGEYLAIDDHGLLYFYSESNWFGDLCRDFAFRDEVRPLIMTAPHWHYRPAHAEERWAQFIRRLNLEAV